MKRLCDICLAFLGLLIVLPVICIFAILIKLDSKGPVFYRGLRVGRYGVPFRMLKLRTMVTDAEKIGGSSTSDEDPRITKLGQLIRQFKIDELPQLINVFKGEMSFVGPRPEVPQFVELFTEEEKVILTVRPGITDWASIWDSDEGAILVGSLDPDKTYLEKIRPEKIRLQLEYVRKRCFWVDLKILAKTFSTLVHTRIQKLTSRAA